MKRTIEWQSPNSDVVHTIPEHATVTLRVDFDNGGHHVIKVRIDENGEILNCQEFQGLEGVVPFPNYGC